MAVKHWGVSMSARSYPLSGSVDATGQTWHEVPGYGLVNWTLEQITEQAGYLFDLHRPDQTTVRVRIAWGPGAPRHLAGSVLQSLPDQMVVQNRGLGA
jgi:hypothetical protein